MRTTTGRVPAERTKMSAPAGLWIVCDLKVEGSSGCAMAAWAEIRAVEIASRAVRVILERSFIYMSSSVWSLNHYTCTRQAILGDRRGVSKTEDATDGKSFFLNMT